MCFSPEASFAGGIIISAIGVITVRKVYNPSQIIFASVPLFFGLQQIAEGFLWLTLPLEGYDILRRVSCYTFLIMAQVIWPVMIPLSVLFMEISKKKKKVLSALVTVGAILSVYYSFCLLSFDVNPQIEGFHIKYHNDFPESIADVAFIFYLSATIIPLFVSSVKKNASACRSDDIIMSGYRGLFHTIPYISLVFFRSPNKWCNILDPE